MRLINFKEHCW